ncbi:MAG: glycosyltransferase family 4 protein [Chloroflexi bacterium]|nr:glycosyltransferase family 4 protein [Chloroflexota bacterium]
MSVTETTLHWRRLKSALGRGRLVQLISDLSAGDAVSDDAISWQRLLSRVGVDAPIYGRTIVPGHGARAWPLHRLRLESSDVLILHYSVWSEAAALVASMRRPTVLAYHNVTPPEFFAQFEPAMVAETSRGRAALPSLADLCPLAIARSEFSARDLHAAGFVDVRTLPIVLPDEAMADRGERVASPATLLYAGRVAPHKRVEDLLAILAYCRRARTDVTLAVVGAFDAASEYYRALHRCAFRLGVHTGVRFAGKVSRARFVAEYRSARIFVTMSEHEGFGVPLLEALRVDLPIVARAAGAIPEIVGDAGILLEGRRPDIAAEIILEILADSSLQQRMIERGKVRAAFYSADEVLPCLASLLTDGIEATRRR